MKKVFITICSILCALIVLCGISALNAQVPDEIKEAYIDLLHEQGKLTDKTASDVMVDEYYGTTNGYTVCTFAIKDALYTDDVEYLELAGVTFTFTHGGMSNSFYAYKDGDLILVYEAYENGIFSDSDIRSIAVAGGDLEIIYVEENNIRYLYNAASCKLIVEGKGRTADYESHYYVPGPYSPVTFFEDEIHEIQVCEGITYLGDHIFSQPFGHGKLTKVSLPDSLEEIGRGAFDNQSNLTSIEFPEGIKEIGPIGLGSDNKYTDNHLEEIRFYGNAPKLRLSDLFVNFDGTVYYPSGNPTWSAEIRKTYEQYSRYIEWVEWDAPEIKKAQNKFVDVPANAWYTDAVNYCYDADIVAGMNQTEFRPNGNLTRAQFTYLLANFDGADLTEYSKRENSFTDVQYYHWHFAAVEWAYENGYIAGIGNGHFAPEAALTREQLARILYLYAEKNADLPGNTVDMSLRADLGKFSDMGKISDWAYEQIQWAVAVGIINGTSDTTLSPRNITTRAQACQMFMTFANTLHEGKAKDTSGAFAAIANYVTENGTRYRDENYFIYSIVIKEHNEMFSVHYNKSESRIDFFYKNEGYRTDIGTTDYRGYACMTVDGLASEYEYYYLYQSNPRLSFEGRIGNGSYTETFALFENSERYCRAKESTARENLLTNISMLLNELGLTSDDLFVG